MKNKLSENSLFEVSPTVGTAGTFLEPRQYTLIMKDMLALK